MGRQKVVDNHLVCTVLIEVEVITITNVIYNHCTYVFWEEKLEIPFTQGHLINYDNN